MVRHGLLAACCLVVVAHVGLGTAWAEEQPLPIRRVILYKHGVGYFERQGPVEGDAEIRLHFKAKDMSDLLKSLTVLDLGGGSIRAIAYDSTKTVDQQLAEYTFNLRNARSLPAILEQMKGSEVALRVPGGGDGEITGRILAVEKRLERADNTTIETYILSILMDGGSVKKYDLDDIEDIRFRDPRLRKDLTDYLGILFRRHRRDEKELVIRTKGRGRRDVFVSYIREQPVWKVSYRIVLAEEEKPLLQAWAIVDNVSEEDWENVGLSLVSGLPVSFVQNLYDPHYVKRPVVQMQKEVAMRPVMHEAKAFAAAPQALALEGRRRLRKGKAVAVKEGVHMDMVAGGAAIAPRANLLAGMARQATAAVAKATGALFVYDIKERVTVRRDRSALLPIANARVEARRVSVYNESTRRQNPMDAIRLKNTTGLTLEGGPVTVIEENTYAGEALMDTLKPDEDRYVSFAVDLGTRVNTKHGSSSQDIYRVRFVRGTMWTDYRQQRTKVYNLNNVEDKDKTVIIEHPFQRGWKLVKTPEPLEKTDHYYRFEVKVPARKTSAFTVIEERPGSTSYAVTNLSRDRILFFVRQKYMSARARTFLEKVAALQGEIARLKAGVKENERQRDGIFKNHERLRRNMGALGRTEGERKLRARYVKKFELEENRLEAITQKLKELKARIRQKQNELDSLVSGFTFESRT